LTIFTIILTFITLSLKYGYDHKMEDLLKKADNVFLNFSSTYLQFETLAVLDSIIVFLMSLMLIQFTSYWLSKIGDLIKVFAVYFRTTLRTLCYFVITLNLLLSVYFHLFYGGISLGFYDYPVALMRTNLLLF
jgi:hypothetical protein